MPTRRDFLATAIGSAIAGRFPAIILPPRYDLVIRGGMVYDGGGGGGVTRDVAIAGGRIAAVSRRVAGRGAHEIDARDRAVAPGFIDIHSHADGSLWKDPLAESVVRQGVTTVVVGQDGSSRAPRDPSDDEDRANQFDDFAALWRAIADLAPAINVASMVGLGSVRANVVGLDDRPATAAELARMTAIVDRALAQGACGASSGLEYTPGAFAPRSELIALCRPLAKRRLAYATHMRNEDDQLVEAVDEAIAVAEGAGSRLQISHLKTQGPRNWGKLDTVFAHITAARRRGLDVAFDRYPYIAYQTGLTNIFPVWTRDGGTDAFLARLADSTTAPRIRREAIEKVDLIGGWQNVMISGVADDRDRRAEGMRLSEWAASQGTDPYDAAVALLVHSRANVGMVGFAMSEDNLERILAHPLGMVCSDGGAFATSGPARTGHPHPRGLGTFPRVLARYVRERKVLTLGQAIRKMTSLPASRLGIHDRGWLRTGAAADVVVFDPATVEDRATFADPFQYPVGIDSVVVNGVVALAEGQRGERRGVGVRPATA